MEPFYPLSAKLLLFGEHSVLLGSPAVTTPLKEVTAVFRYPEGKIRDEGKQSNHHLQEFFKFLRNNESTWGKYIDLSAMEKAIHRGLYLDSQIPSGYGLGSSAGVCVATYHAFGLEKLREAADLKKLYSQMESFFHGRSSGLDPLTIHYNKTMVVRGEQIDFPEIHELLEPGVYAYLLDSGINRNAADMIRIFQQELTDPEFKYRFQTEYLPILEVNARNILQAGFISWDTLMEISRLQAFFFRRLIPDPIYRIWKSFQDSGITGFKLLGAGGGGYFLCFSKKPHFLVPGFRVLKMRL